jgi:23S rRNA pseudouridine2605 synthase
MEERVQKLMSRAGLGSRRHSERLIRDGRVRINGRRAKLGDRANPEKDQIEVNGKRLQIPENSFIYVAVHKPKGVISSLEDELQRGRPTVRELVDVPGHLYPVGRLDKPSTGLMLLTNDGELAHRLTHPRFGHEKVYRVLLEGHIEHEDLQAWRKGVWLDGRRSAPAEVRVIDQNDGRTQLEITMREGRKRQIRRIASSFDLPVISLVRVRIGPLSLGALKPGQWRFLTQDEVRALQMSVSPTGRHGEVRDKSDRTKDPAKQ